MTILFVVDILMIVAGLGWLIYAFNQKIEDIKLQLDQINTVLDVNGVKSDGKFTEARFRSDNGQNDPDEAA